MTRVKDFLFCTLWFFMGVISVSILDLAKRTYLPVIDKNNIAAKKEDINGPANLPERSKNLTIIYKTYNGSHKFHHWKEYAAKYENNLYPILEKLPREKSFRMLEIGVQSGGSVNVWKSYFSRPFYYVGIDIDVRCKRSEDVTQNIYIEIGSQLNQQELINVCKKHGPFHFIVDDGGHTFEMMKTALKTLFISDQCMEENSLYVIEDMHTMVMKEYSRGPTDIPSIPGELFRLMHYYWYEEPFEKWKINVRKEKIWADRVKSIALYDSMMFIHHHNGHGPLTIIKRGKNSFKNDEKKLQPNDYASHRASKLKWGWKQW